MLWSANKLNLGSCVAQRTGYWINKRGACELGWAGLTVALRPRGYLTECPALHFYLLHPFFLVIFLKTSSLFSIAPFSS
jgi:hypothetical protein